MIKNSEDNWMKDICVVTNTHGKRRGMIEIILKNHLDNIHVFSCNTVPNFLSYLEEVSSYEGKPDMIINDFTLDQEDSLFYYVSPKENGETGALEIRKNDVSELREISREYEIPFVQVPYLFRHKLPKIAKKVFTNPENYIVKRKGLRTLNL